MEDFGSLLFAALFNPFRFAVAVFGCAAAKRPLHLLLVVVVATVLVDVLPGREQVSLTGLAAGLLASTAYAAALWPIVIKVRRRRAADDSAP